MPFCGNVLFASHNAFKKVTQSRRDDLISLAYLLEFFINGEITWLGEMRSEDDDFYQEVSRTKK